MYIWYKPVWDNKMKAWEATWMGGAPLDFAMVKFDGKPVSRNTCTFDGYVTVLHGGNIGEDWRLRFAILPAAEEGQLARVRGTVWLFTSDGKSEIPVLGQSQTGVIRNRFWKPAEHTSDLQLVIETTYNHWSYPTACGCLVERAKDILNIAVTSALLFEYTISP